MFDVYDRSCVSVPSPDRVERQEEDEDAYPDHAAPVHFARRRVGSSWEELEYPKHREEA